MDRSEATATAWRGKDALAPFVVLRLPGAEALNLRLRETLLAMAATMPDRGSNMPGGRSFFDNKWLSPSSLYREDVPAFRDIRAAIEAAANEAAPKDAILGGDRTPLRVVSMWSIVSRAEMEGRRHNHKGILSAAYYVDAGSSGAEDGGLMQLYAEPGAEQPSHSVVPEAGLLVLFPSGLQHSVSRYAGVTPRIVISANLNVAER